MIEKICKKCGIEKPVDDFYFYKSKNYRDGLCKKCRNENNNQWKRTNLKTMYYLREKLISENKNKCFVCDKIKPLSAFRKSKHSKLGYLGTCRGCVSIQEKNTKLKQAYGIDLGVFNDILKDQNNTCAICKINLIGQKTCVDHNHKTNEIRGILCDRCNRGLGLLKDDKKVLYSAIRYLKLAHVKSDKLLGNPEEDNQQPI